MRTRSILSPVLGALFAISAFTGLLLLVHIRSGPVHGIHQIASVLMVVVAGLHWNVNWKGFVAFCRQRRILTGCCAALLALSLGLCALGFFVEGPGHPPSHEERDRSH